MAISKLEIFKESMKFSAAHFTIFSATTRERLHGHNFQVYASFLMDVANEEGLSVDYRQIKQLMNMLCNQWDEYLLLPAKSKYLKFEEREDILWVLFNNERIPFLKKDLLLLDISNTTVEELSKCFAKKLSEVVKHKNWGIRRIEVKISSGEGQWGGHEIEVEGKKVSYE